jgi:hypothetical protein
MAQREGGDVRDDEWRTTFEGCGEMRRGVGIIGVSMRD